MNTQTTAPTGTSTSAAWLHLPFERDDLAVGLVDLWHEEVADGGFWAEVHAMISYFGRQNVLSCSDDYGNFGRLNH